MRRDNDELLIIVALLLQIIASSEEDPFLAERLYDRLRRRLGETEAWDPELDELFRRSLFERDPEYTYELYRRLRDQLRRLEFWDPELDFLLERSVMRRPRRPDYRAIERITELAFEEFGRRTEKSVEKNKEEIEGKLKEFARHDELITEQIHNLSLSHEKLQQSIQSQSTSITETKSEYHTYFWLSASGVDISKVKLTRYVPARIYIADPVPSRKQLDDILHLVGEFAGQLGFELSDDLPEENGSWWKRMFLKTKELLTHKEVTDRVAKAEQALELKHLDKPQADANKTQAQAASLLIRALKDTQAACVQVGSLLIVKAPRRGSSAIYARTLTHEELIELEENQAMLGKPDQVLEWLQNCQTKRLPSSKTTKSD